MYIRKCRQKKDGKVRDYWQLVESYRTKRGPRQRVVAYLGTVEESVRLGVAQAATEDQTHQKRLFGEIEPEWVEVDTRRIRVERVREFGGAWLGPRMLDMLGITELFHSAIPRGREDIEWSVMAEALIPARLCDPSSELRLAEHLYERTALVDLFGLEVKLCPSPDGEETFILCRSKDRQEKEKAIHERFEKRVEEGLQRIAESCRLIGKQNPVDVAKRLGKLLGRNTRVEKLFDVNVSTRKDGGAEIVWTKVDAWREWSSLSEGCYLLRGNIMGWSAEDLWKAYIQLTQAEAAFRIQKQDLAIRPVWHQKKERVQAHILVCFLAYALWKTFGRLCQRAGLGDEPRKVFEEISQIRTVDVVLPTKSGMEIRRRCVGEPTKHQAILLSYLGLTLPKQLKIYNL